MIESLGRRYGLSAGSARQLETLVDFLTTGDRAPTAVTDRAGILRDHIADSLVALERDDVRDAAVVADLGSGAGFPGLPLAIALPRSRVHLVESNGRKCAFIARAAERCSITNALIVHSRAEDWRTGLRSCDLVTARALAPLAVVAEYAAPLLRIGGVMLAWRGRRDPDDEAAGARAALELGLEVLEPIRVVPYPGAAHRHLHPLVKAAETPERFPRRAGIARKRPLGGSAASDRARR